MSNQNYNKRKISKYENILIERMESEVSNIIPELIDNISILLLKNTEEKKKKVKPGVYFLR